MRGKNTYIQLYPGVRGKMTYIQAQNALCATIEICAQGKNACSSLCLAGFFQFNASY